MGKKLRWRVLLIVLVVVGAIAGYVFTGYQHAKKEWTGPGQPGLKDALKKAIKLGLDLRGGIFGRITALDEERGFVILQVSDNAKIKVLRSAIGGLASEPEATSVTTAT